MPKRNCTSVNLPAKYRPLALTEVVGHPEVVSALLGFVASVEAEPASAAFVFHGPTGVGKTAAAWALAGGLGCSLDDPEMGGVYEIPSGKQDGKAVEELLRLVRVRPFYGSGWRVVIVNEADRMTSQAESIWLDGLEKLPPRTVVIFTTNELGRLSDRLIGRCEAHAFSGTSEVFQRAMVRLIREVWKKETGRTIRRIPEGLGCFELASGELSIRLALQQIAPYARTGRELPAKLNVPFIREVANGASASGSAAAKKSWETRRRNGERQVVA